MNQYDMTLIAVAEKQVKIQAESAEDAAKVVEILYNKTDILDFQNGDVSDISVVGIEHDQKGNGYKNIESYCKNCGRNLKEDCGHCGESACEECHWSCPDCGGCMHPPGKKLP